ncbi:MAG: DUF3106 domain-containing protein [Deltaproteobacteria bacterium]|nr:DUF3106 domain-containing protein [Deltaproteobacteria bacterium]
MLKRTGRGLLCFPGMILAAGVIMLLTQCSWGGDCPATVPTEKQFRDEWGKRPLKSAQGDNRLYVTDNREMRRQYEEWQSLSPEEKKRLRQKMEQWKQIPPDQKELYKKRHQQWQQIDPAEREKLEEKILRWNELPPEERDRIRMKFRE